MQGEWSLAKAGMPNDLLDAITDYHMLTWYTVQDQGAYQLHNIGVKPGDGLVDAFVLQV